MKIETKPRDTAIPFVRPLDRRTKPRDDEARAVAAELARLRAAIVECDASSVEAR